MHKANSLVATYSQKQGNTFSFGVSRNRLLLINCPEINEGDGIELLRSIYSSYGMATPKDAIEVALDYMPDAVVLDSYSKYEGLLNVIYAFKNNLLTCHLPIIVINKESSNKYKLQALEAGADVVLCQPFSGELIKFQIDNLIRNRKLLKSYYTKEAYFINCLPSFSFEEQFINRVDRLLENNYHDIDYNVSQLAKDLVISRTNLYTKIKTLTGRTTSEYMRIFRLKKGAEFLKQGLLNVSEVTFSVGLKDPKYFSKMFKSVFGITPSDFKRGNTVIKQLQEQY